MSGHARRRFGMRRFGQGSFRRRGLGRQGFGRSRRSRDLGAHRRKIDRRCRFGHRGARNECNRRRLDLDRLRRDRLCHNGRPLGFVPLPKLAPHDCNEQAREEKTHEQRDPLLHALSPSVLLGGQGGSHFMFRDQRRIGMRRRNRSGASFVAALLAFAEKVVVQRVVVRLRSRRRRVARFEAAGSRRMRIYVVRVQTFSGVGARRAVFFVTLMRRKWNELSGPTRRG
jgi:hypothetical protein